MRADVLTIVGLGLIGGSVAAAARRAESASHVRAVDTDPATCAYALEHKLADEALTPREALSAGWFGPCDPALKSGQEAISIVVLAAPVPVTIEWLGRLAKLGYTGIVTDVSSTKRAVVEAALAAERHTEERGGTPYRFVGGHPMAGSERSGVVWASESLFDGGYYILTPTATTSMDAYKIVHSFVSTLGARVISLDATVHDEAVAIVSHVPHVVAAGLVTLASTRAAEAGADLMRLAAGGFKDMTRIAAGSADLWTGICLDNADALEAGLKDLQKLLHAFGDALEHRDAAAVRAWLAGAADVRRSLPAQWVPATATLHELVVPITDRPGTVSVVTTALGRAGCNIEDIEIDHESESRAILRLVLTDEGDFASMLTDLEGHGFSPQLRPLEQGED